MNRIHICFLNVIGEELVRSIQRESDLISGYDVNFGVRQLVVKKLKTLLFC
ncbi:hypothetical protein LEP1GSC171_3105 [Leptospira santarosai str. HAI1380]|nr:hypothetical protein LEP1GSC168_1339 [Leptospira santarosai str. HAI134]EMO32641.1 hypothetical protein LEP1GSC175_1073 [Leptospira santarosai str. HAI821]EMP02167.1 hypothetical protein LEP1GSC171_3105 [Leptospira santarosai str. HAI1380]EMP82557.1 hypothetical protein LEP1GSC162_2893 [Leptospira santarosai str. CBC1531]